MRAPWLLLLALPLVSARLGGRNGGGSVARSGVFQRFYSAPPRNNAHVSARHAHYSYHPPQQINFMCRFCSSHTAYPVFHAPLPTYVYKYRESGGRLGALLAGLALYNLGRAAADHSHFSHYYHQQSADEDCSLQVLDHQHFEETRVPCFMVSTFMERAAAEPQGPRPQANQFDITTSHIDVTSFVKTNSSETPLEVTTEQECVIWHNTSLTKESNKVPCALLKQYAETLKAGGVPVYIWLPATLALVLGISACCQCCNRKKRLKEEAPLAETTVLGYSSYCP